uniref:Uncharacterized protein n=1 Tax=Oryza punctata TaxID=4537 RepID=A0A0E0LZY8_ORYPU
MLLPQQDSFATPKKRRTLKMGATNQSTLHISIASPHSTMEYPDEGNGGSFNATPRGQPVLLQSADLQVDKVGEPEDQQILLSSTHPDLPENQDKQGPTSAGLEIQT